MIIKNRRSDKEFRDFLRSLYDFYQLTGSDKLPQFSTELWENIFVWHFGELPNSQKDPRWDELLTGKGGLQADERVSAIIKRARHLVKKRAA